MVTIEKTKTIYFDNICQVVRSAIVWKEAKFEVHCFDAFKDTSLQCRPNMVVFRNGEGLKILPPPQTPSGMIRVITRPDEHNI